jgi:hypothetical protein
VRLHPRNQSERSSADHRRTPLPANEHLGFLVKMSIKMNYLLTKKLNSANSWIVVVEGLMTACYRTRTGSIVVESSAIPPPSTTIKAGGPRPD